MDPNYATFWSAFKATDAWAGLVSIARYSEAVELRLLRLMETHGLADVYTLQP